MLFLQLNDLQQILGESNLLLSAAVVVIGWILATFLPKLIYKIDEKSERIEFSQATHELIKKLLSFGIWMVTIIVLIFVSGLSDFIVSFFSDDALESKVLQVVIVWLIVYVFVKYISSAFQKFDDIVEAVDFSNHAHQLVQKFINYIAYTIAIIVSLQIFELTGVFTALLAGAGVAGIVIGFAAQDVFSNFLSGIFLVLDKPFKIGDVIEVKGADVIGTVKEISLRTTQVTTFDNLKVTLPNKVLSTNAIINYSRYGNRRIDFEVGVGYGTDLEKAGKLLLDSARKDPSIVTTKGKEPFVTLSFADSAVNYKVYAWIDTKEGILGIKRRMMEGAYAVLNKNKVEIPFPQIVVHSPEKKSKKKKS